MPAQAVVRIDVEFTLTCAAPWIRARMIRFDEIAIGANATVGVVRVCVVVVVHTVSVRARLVVVSVHVGHVGRLVRR